METKIRVRVKALYEKYQSILNIWFSKHDVTHKLYDLFVKLEKILKGEIGIRDDKMLQELVKNLNKFFPDDRFFPKSISLDSDDDEDPSEDIACVNAPTDPIPPLEPSNSSQKPSINKEKVKPVHAQSSIAEYKTKTSMLKPAAAYAKPSNTTKVKISAPYKESLAQTKFIDPKDEAIKLKNIKEKIYSKMYLKVNLEEQENSTNKPEEKPTDESPTSPPSENANKLIVIPCKRKRITKLKNLTETQSDDDLNKDENENFEKIPIQKSQSKRRRGRPKKIEK